MRTSADREGMVLPYHTVKYITGPEVAVSGKKLQTFLFFYIQIPFSPRKQRQHSRCFFFSSCCDDMVPSAVVCRRVVVSPPSSIHYYRVLYTYATISSLFIKILERCHDEASLRSTWNRRSRPPPPAGECFCVHRSVKITAGSPLAQESSCCSQSLVKR